MLSGQWKERAKSLTLQVCSRRTCEAVAGVINGGERVGTNSTLPGGSIGNA